MGPMRERNDEAAGSVDGALGGVGENASDDVGGGFGDGAVDAAPVATDGDAPVAGGAVDGSPFPVDDDGSGGVLGDTFDTGADGGIAAPVDTPLHDDLPDDEVADGSLDMDLGQPGQSHTIVEGVEFLVDELHDVVFGDGHHPGIF